MSYDYDLLVIGSGPAGEKAAVKAAYFDKRVALVERSEQYGGECLKGGLPSKVLRDAALSYSGARRRLGDLFRTAPGHRLPMEWFTQATAELCDMRIGRINHNLERHGVDCHRGSARFEDAHTISIGEGHEARSVTAEHIVIATGSRPQRPGFVPFAAPNVHCTDTLLDMRELPKSMVIVGAGAIGAEYATIFANLDVEVHLLDTRPRVLPFLDAEIGDRLLAGMRKRGVRTHLGQAVTEARAPGPERAEVVTDKGEVIAAEVMLFSGGRLANTESLGLEQIGVEVGRRGRPVVNDNFQTTLDPIYAVGDVIGFPSLASTAMEQGRAAVAHALEAETGRDLSGRPDVIPLDSSSPYPLIPYGIYTIPSVSMVGQTEEQLAKTGRPYVVGRAAYGDQDRGQLLGDPDGLLKLLCDKDTREVLGVHIVGEMAEEIIHIGQACMHFGGTIEYFLRTVFNFPTLGSLYKSAAYDVLTRMGPQRDKLSHPRTRTSSS